ncbi:hypothetical protein RDI58_018026 [Solanum bulbocastanum]|uniref:Uncharacterized protein n=1 Tax=Solanum bulbocastanum TaxID=147425 RepID=A0AAN8YAJ3_SOLBU
MSKGRKGEKIAITTLDIENDSGNHDTTDFITFKINKHMLQEVRDKQDTEEDDNMTANIHDIGREGDVKRSRTKRNDFHFP